MLGSGSLVVIDNTTGPPDTEVRGESRQGVGGGGGGGSVCDGAGKAFCSGKIMLNNTLFIVSYC